MSKTIIGVHLDFKGMMLRFHYQLQWLQDLAAQGVNTVLVEYEDAFPFDTLKVAGDPHTAWNEDMLAEFLARARELDIEVIPLQQTLGHLEYLLGQESYRKYALDWSYPGTLDIYNPEGRALVHCMLEEVMRKHPESRYIHIGLDEARILTRGMTGEETFEILIRYIEGMCDFCAAHGKTPIMWTDMLEDYLTVEGIDLLSRIRERVVLCIWDYKANGRPQPEARLIGRRVSREWLAEPQNPCAPTIGTQDAFIEDLPLPMRALLKPSLQGRLFEPLFQSRLWSGLGFRVLGCSSVRLSADGPVMPHFSRRIDNVVSWSNACARDKLAGHIVSSWARGTSWCRPNFPAELSWYTINTFAASMGAAPADFFPGIPPQTVKRIIQSLGRCREDWRIEARLATEMDQLAGQVTAHKYEWEALSLMAKTLDLHRRIAFAAVEVDEFRSANRLVDSEWERRLREEDALLEELESLGATVEAHFSQRYHGSAFREWIEDLFMVPRDQLLVCREVCLAKLEEKKLVQALEPQAR